MPRKRKTELPKIEDEPILQDLPIDIPAQTDPSTIHNSKNKKDPEEQKVLEDIKEGKGLESIETSKGLEPVPANSQPAQTPKKRKVSFSKALCIITVVIFTGVAIFAIMDYYALMRLAIQNSSSVVPDAALPIAGITGILAAVLSYTLYQGTLKTSLNKNHLTIDGDGIIKPILENILKDEEGK